MERRSEACYVGELKGLVILACVQTAINVALPDLDATIVRNMDTSMSVFMWQLPWNEALRGSLPRPVLPRTCQKLRGWAPEMPVTFPSAGTFDTLAAIVNNMAVMDRVDVALCLPTAWSRYADQFSCCLC